MGIVIGFRAIRIELRLRVSGIARKRVECAQQSITILATDNDKEMLAQKGNANNEDNDTYPRAWPKASGAARPPLTRLEVALLGGG